MKIGKNGTTRLVIDTTNEPILSSRGSYCNRPLSPDFRDKPALLLVFNIQPSLPLGYSVLVRGLLQKRPDFWVGVSL